MTTLHQTIKLVQEFLSFAHSLSMDLGWGRSGVQITNALDAARTLKYGDTQTKLVPQLR